MAGLAMVGRTGYFEESQSLYRPLVKITGGGQRMGSADGSQDSRISRRGEDENPP
jgi:hypothetical protein